MTEIYLSNRGICSGFTEHNGFSVPVFVEVAVSVVFAGCLFDRSTLCICHIMIADNTVRVQYRIYHLILGQIGQVEVRLCLSFDVWLAFEVKLSYHTNFFVYEALASIIFTSNFFVLVLDCCYRSSIHLLYLSHIQQSKSLSFCTIFFIYFQIG